MTRTRLTDTPVEHDASEALCRNGNERSRTYRERMTLTQTERWTKCICGYQRGRATEPRSDCSVCSAWVESIVEELRAELTTECTECARKVRDERMYHDAAGSGAVWCCDCFWGGTLPADVRGIPTVAGR